MNHRMERRMNRRMNRWTWLLLGAVVVGLGLYLQVGTLVLLAVLFAVVVPFEKLCPRHPGQRIRRAGVLTDIGYALALPVLDAVRLAAGVVIGVVSFAWLPGLLLAPVIAALPPLVTGIVGVLLFDVAAYWAHRWAHEVPALWRFHQVHHSPEQMDWVSGFRNHPFDGIVIAPAVVLLLAAGFDPAFAGALAAVQIVSGIFLHANVGWRLRPLHRLVATPEFHHWHHANEADARCSNYAGFLPVIDVVFGSYYMPDAIRPVRYGIDDELPDHLVGQLAAPLRDVGRPWRWCRRPVRGMRRLAGGLRTLLRDVWASTTRPRRRRPGPGEPFGWALHAPSDGPAIAGADLPSGHAGDPALAVSGQVDDRR